MTGTLMVRLLTAIRSTRAVSAAEYAILAVGIVVVVAGAATAFGPKLKDSFTAIGTKITTTQGTVGTSQ